MSLVFIGAVNFNNLPKGGEEYKNQLLVKKLSIEKINFSLIDTYQWQCKPKVWIRLFFLLFYQKKSTIVISASSASTYKFLTLITWIRPDLLNNIVYLVIGGYLPEGIKIGKYKWKIYEPLKNIVLEGSLLANQIRNISQLTNLRVVPNFKTFPRLNFVKYPLSVRFKFVFVGRISQGKGIMEIIKASEILKLENINFCIDFYGPVEDQFPLNNGILNYKGFLDIQGDPVKSYTKLSEYDCMLFPTYWMGEGFPGVIVDAFIAGLPVIATDWNMNSEIIEEGKNGFLIEPKNAEALADKMMYVINNRDNLEQIRINNLARAKDYHINTVWPELLKLL